MFKLENYKEKRIAVVGVSSDPSKYGHKIFRDLVANGYKVYGVNPKNGVLFGKKIYPNLKSIIDSGINIDMVMLVVPPDVSEKIVDECRDLEIKEIWFQPGSESENAIKKAESYGIKVTHGACFMVQSGIW